MATLDLQAVGNLGGVLHMAGHALHIYEIKFTTQTASAVGSVSGSLMILNEENVDFSIPILLDTMSSIGAPPPEQKYRTEQQLPDNFTSDFLSSCDAELG